MTSQTRINLSDIRQSLKFNALAARFYRSEAVLALKHCRKLRKRGKADSNNWLGEAFSCRAAADSYAASTRTLLAAMACIKGKPYAGKLEHISPSDLAPHLKSSGFCTSDNQAKAIAKRFCEGYGPEEIRACLAKLRELDDENARLQAVTATRNKQSEAVAVAQANVTQAQARVVQAQESVEKAKESLASTDLAIIDSKVRIKSLEEAFHSLGLPIKNAESTMVPVD